jgi:N,N-dimethylformamidase
MQAMRRDDLGRGIAPVFCANMPEPGTEGGDVTAALIGYADKVSVHAGGSVAFKVSSVGPDPYQAKLVRIVRGDPNPKGPGAKFEDLSHVFARTVTSREQRAWPGSYALVEGATAIKLPQALLIEALIWPTLPADGEQTVISRRDPQSGVGFALVLTADGMMLEVGSEKVAVGKPLRAHTWYRVWASADRSSGMLRVGQQPLKRAFPVDDEGEA